MRSICRVTHVYSMLYYSLFNSGEVPLLVLSLKMNGLLKTNINDSGVTKSYDCFFIFFPPITAPLVSR